MRNHTRRLVPFAVSIVCTLVLALAPAAAQDADVEAQYQRANDLRNRHDDAGALVILEGLYARTHEARALARVGLAEAALGRWVLAERHLVEATGPTQEGWIAQNRAALESVLVTVRPDGSPQKSAA